MIRSRARDEGSSPVEFAIIATAMIVLTFVVIQVGLVFYAKSLATAAATQGVQSGRGYHATADAGQTRAEEFLQDAGFGLTGASVTVTRTGQDVEVVVSGSAISVLPGFDFAIRQSAHGSVERQTTETAA